MDNIWIPTLVPIGEIDPNPWQVRGEDSAHVMDVASSIAEHDLFQPGLGRRVDGRVQLAMAHTRLAAFKFLDETFGERGNGQAGGKYVAFPIIIRELTDEQMAAYAIEENFKRKDMSAIEKGRALHRYMKDFGKTQSEAGGRFHLVQSAVSHLLRLLDLPEPVQDLVNEGKLPERFARQLVSLARVTPEGVIEAAQMIAGVPSDERDEVADQALNDLLDEHGRNMTVYAGCYWPPDWRPDSATSEAAYGAAKCHDCPVRLVMRGNAVCTDAACFDARAAAWQERELQRVADKFKIEIAHLDDGMAKPLAVDYNNESVVKAVLKHKNKPDCLRVMPLPERSYKWNYHESVLGSPVVVLGSVDANILKREQQAKEHNDRGEPEGTFEDAPDGKTEDDERQGRREQRAAVRKAQHDIPWLVFSVAEACADQVKASGTTLDWLVKLADEHYHAPSGWEEFAARWEPLMEQIGIIEMEDLPKVKEPIKRQFVLTARLADAIDVRYDPNQRYDVVQAVENIQDEANDLSLKLPAGWGKPPVWKTTANCHVCGQFTSMDHVTKRDEEEGWKVEGEVVTCSDECRAQLADPQVAAKKVAKKKSQPVKKSQAKGKKR